MYRSINCLVLILFTYTIGYAQSIGYSQSTNYTITYIRTIANDNHVFAAEDKLYISLKEDRTLYINGKSKVIKDPPRKPNEIVIYDKQIFEEFFYFDFKKSLLYSRIKPWDTTYFIKEDVPTMNWTLEQETTLNEEGITLHKAILYFRGRNYTAWYAIDYPIQVGPWKFNNLPGLVFEIYDEDKRYHWALQKIEINKFKILPFQYDINRANETIQSYQKKYYAELDRLVNGPQRSPFGNIPGIEILETISDPDQLDRLKNSDLEIKYEWEE